MSADKKALYEINKELRSVRDEMASLFKPPKLEIKKIDRDSGGELTMAQKEFKINKESEELAKIRETLKTQEEVDDFNKRVDALNALSTSYVKEAEAEQKRQQDLQKQTSSKMLELNGKFNTLLGEAEAARKKLGEDKEGSCQS